MHLFGVILICALSSLSHAQSGAVHLPIYRRGGRFVQNNVANLTDFSQSLSSVTSRYLRFSRVINGNRLYRAWHSDESADAHIFDEAGLDGRWYATVHVGTPPQPLEVDLDMLTPDFYHLMTTSGRGTKLDTYTSSSFEPSNIRVHLDCTTATDLIHLHKDSPGTRLTLPICQPAKSSAHTLSSSGSILGLAPFTTLSQLSTPSLLRQLTSQNLIPHKIWSLTLLDSTTGILSLGSTLAQPVERIKLDSEIRLDHLSDPTLDQNAINQESQQRLDFLMPSTSTYEEHFEWTHPLDNTGARGWWHTLMTGVWINGVKILKNQPVILDVNCPVILAPRTAARHVYAHISGALPFSMNDHDPHSFSSASPQHPPPAYNGRASESERDREEFTFYAYPCLNPPQITLEIASWPFPIFTTPDTAQDRLSGLPGGPFSLGKVATNNSNVDTGYCVGRIVGRDFIGEQWADVGLRDTWVLGEPFFRGLGVVGDLGDEHGGEKIRIGVRKF